MNDNEAKALPGQPFKPPPARIWNDMVDAGRAYRDGFFSSGAPERTRPRETDVIKVKNTSGADRSRGHVVGFDGSVLDECTPENIWLISNQAIAGENFGVLRYPVEQDEITECQISGVCIAKINIIDISHTHANAPAIGGYVLQSASSGSVAILYKPSLTGERDCVVLLNSPSENRLVRFELKQNFLTGIANAKIKNMEGDQLEEASVLDPEGIFEELVARDVGLAIKQDGKYYAIQAPCGGIETSSSSSGE